MAEVPAVYQRLVDSVRSFETKHDAESEQELHDALTAVDRYRSEDHRELVLPPRRRRTAEGFSAPLFVEGIVSRPAALGGTPVIEGTEVPALEIGAQVSAGVSIERILHGYPGLTVERIQAAVKFATLLQDRQDPQDAFVNENTNTDQGDPDAWKRRANHFMKEAKRLREANERAKHALYMIQIAIEDVMSCGSSSEQRCSDDQEFVVDRWPDAECISLCNMFIVKSRSRGYVTDFYLSSEKAWSAAAAHILAQMREHGENEGEQQ